MPHRVRLSERRPRWRPFHKGRAKARILPGPNFLPATPPSLGIREQGECESTTRATRRRKQTARAAGTASAAHGAGVLSKRSEQSANYRKVIGIHGKDTESGGWGQPAPGSNHAKVGAQKKFHRDSSWRRPHLPAQTMGRATQCRIHRQRVVGTFFPFLHNAAKCER